jgi:hypothetical protein
MSDPLRFLKFVAQWLTNFVSHLIWLLFMMFSISPNLKGVSRYPRRLLKPELLRFNPIYPIFNNPSKSWIPRKGSPEGKRSKCIRSYGITTPKRKQLGKRNPIFNRISQLFFQPIPKSNHPIFFRFRISGRDSF